VTDSPAPEKGARCEDLKANCGSASVCHASFRPLVFPGAGEYLHFDQVMSRFGDFDLRRTYWPEPDEKVSWKARRDAVWYSQPSAGGAASRKLGGTGTAGCPPLFSRQAEAARNMLLHVH